MGGAVSAPHLPTKRTDVLGVPLTRITVQEYVDIVRQAVAAGSSLTFTYAHFHTINLAQRDGQAKRILRQIDVVTPDGVTILWATRLFGEPFLRRNITVNEYAMPVLAPELSRQGWSLFLFGGDIGIAERAAMRLKNAYPSLIIAGTHHGQVASASEMQVVVERIAAARPTVLLVGLGQPLQEEWMLRYRERLGIPAVVGCGGYLEKLARRDTVYPEWVNRTHLYWLFRLMTEPGRVWKRYSIGAFQFAWHLGRHALFTRKQTVS